MSLPQAKFPPGLRPHHAFAKAKHRQGCPWRHVSPHQERRGLKILPALGAETRGEIVKTAIEIITRIDGTVTIGTFEISEISSLRPEMRKTQESETGIGRTGEEPVMHVVLRGTDMAAAVIVIECAIGPSVTNVETGQSQDDLVTILRERSRLQLATIEFPLKGPAQRQLQVLRLSRMLLLQPIRGVVSTRTRRWQYQRLGQRLLRRMIVTLEVEDI